MRTDIHTSNKSSVNTATASDLQDSLALVAYENSQARLCLCSRKSSCLMLWCVKMCHVVLMTACRCLLLISSMLQQLLRPNTLQPEQHRSDLPNANLLRTVLCKCSDAVAWVAAWLPAELPAAEAMATSAAAAGEAKQQLWEQLAELQDALLERLICCDTCELSQQQLNEVGC